MYKFTHEGPAARLCTEALPGSEPGARRRVAGVRVGGLQRCCRRQSRGPAERLLESESGTAKGLLGSESGGRRRTAGVKEARKEIAGVIAGGPQIKMGLVESELSKRKSKKSKC